MDGYKFWKQVDSVNPYGSASALAKRMGVTYYAMKQWRADSRIPKAETLLQLSRTLNKSIEFLLTGEEKHLYSERVERIAARCQYAATETQIFMVEQILGLPTESELVSKKDRDEGRSALA